MQADLGVLPPDDRDGCLRDVHWYCREASGGVQSYTIGNILSAPFFAAAIKAHPDMLAEIASGQFMAGSPTTSIAMAVRSRRRRWSPERPEAQ
jgi:Zn-dependent M32 family carboxypeptidase